MDQIHDKIEKYRIKTMQNLRQKKFEKIGNEDEKEDDNL